MQQLDPIYIEPENNAEYSIIWLHGLGADGHDFVPIVPELNLDDAGIRFIFPNAPIRPVTINNGMAMPAWYDIGLINREIEKGIKTKNIILAGFSQGGAVALYTMLRFEGTLGGCIALSTYLPFMNLSKQDLTLDANQTPIFWGHGNQDTVVPKDLGIMSQKHLLDLNFSVEFHTYDMPHSVCHEEIIDISNWLKLRI